MPETAKLNPVWSLGLLLVVFAAMQMCPPERRLYATIGSTVAFVAMQWLLPKSRFRRDHSFSPVNVALVFLLLKLVVVPVLIMLTGGEARTLSQLPAWRSMELSIVIDTVAALALALGLTLAPPSAMRSLPAALRLDSPGPRLVTFYFVLGVVGFVAAFGTPGALIAYFREPQADEMLQQNLEGTMRGLAGTLLRPFLAFAMVAWWGRIAERGRAEGSFWKPLLCGLTAALVVTVANLTFSFNRAAFVFPLVSLLAVYHLHVRRLPLLFFAASALVAVPLLLGVENYRANMRAGRAGADMDAAELLRSFSETVQAYAVGPQFTGTFYEKTNWARDPYLGSTLLASVLSPVPILGKPFREGSGPVIFNRALYDVDGVVDQILPLASELFVNFHSLGVVIGFLVLGMVLAWSEAWFLASPSVFSAFCLQYVFLWMATLSAWSLSVVAQIMIYFFGPVYCFALAAHGRTWLRRVAGRHTPLAAGLGAAAQ